VQDARRDSACRINISLRTQSAYYNRSQAALLLVAESKSYYNRSPESKSYYNRGQAALLLRVTRGDAGHQVLLLLVLPDVREPAEPRDGQQGVKPGESSR
jgi:hypothetical protein